MIACKNRTAGFFPVGNHIDKRISDLSLYPVPLALPLSLPADVLIGGASAVTLTIDYW